MRQILGKTTSHEIAVEKRFQLLKAANQNNTCAISLPELLMSPITCNIPMVENGFVYVLLSKKQYPEVVRYVGQTDSSLLSALRRHNTGQEDCITQSTYLRPWCLVAFVYNFASDSERLTIETHVEDKTANAQSLQSILDELEKCLQHFSESNLRFCKCARVINNNNNME